MKIRRVLCTCLCLSLLLLIACAPLTEPALQDAALEGEEIAVTSAFGDAPPFDSTTVGACAIPSLRKTVEDGKWFSSDITRSGYPFSVAMAGERYLTLSLSETADLTAVRMRWYQGGDDEENVSRDKKRCYYFLIEASEDGDRWTQIYPEKGSGTIAESGRYGKLEHYTCAYEGANYLRIWCMGSDGGRVPADGKYFAVRDIEVYGKGRGGDGGDPTKFDPLYLAETTTLLEKPLVATPVVTDALPDLDAASLSNTEQETVLSDYEAYLSDRYEGISSVNARLSSSFRFESCIGVSLTADVVPDEREISLKSDAVDSHLICGMDFASDEAFGLHGIWADGLIMSVPEAYDKGLVTLDELCAMYYAVFDRVPELEAHTEKELTVYFVRHGKSDYTVSTNATEGVNLTGWVQSRKIAEFFRSKEIDALYSSPYQRCLDTLLPLHWEKNLEIRVIPTIYERTIGSEVESAPEGFAEMQWSDPDYKLEGGESINDVRSRMVVGLDQVFRKAEENGEDTVLVSTHAMALSILLDLYDTDLDYEGYRRILSMNTPCVKCTFEGNTCTSMTFINIADYAFLNT